MKIKKLSVGSYGKISEREFSFSDGINVVYGKNEAGKSTLSSFIRYALYGFSGTKRDVSSNDKLKYMPWQGGAVSGSAVVSTDDGEYRIERRHGAKSSIKVTKNGAECLFGKEPGEELLGVDEASFSRMAYISQNDVCPDSMDKLTDSVQNIVFAADESVNIAKARTKLTEFRNHFRSTRKTGKCYELEEKVRELRYAFDKSSEMHKVLLAAEAKLSEIRIKIKTNNEKVQALEKELLSIDGRDAKLLLEKISAAHTELKEAIDALDAAKSELTFGDTICTENTLSEIIGAFKECRELENKILFIREQLPKVKEEKELGEESAKVRKKTGNNKASGIVSVICFVLAIAFGACWFFTTFYPIAMLACSAAFLAIAIVLAIVSAVQAKKAADIARADGEDAKEYLLSLEAKEQLLLKEHEAKNTELSMAKDLLSRLVLPLGADADSAGDAIVELKKRLDKYAGACGDVSKKEALCKAYLEANDIEDLRERAANYTGGEVRDKKVVLREHEFLKKANENLSELEKQYIKQAASPASALRKPSEILAERQATETVLSEYTLKADAAELALRAIDQACEDLKQGVSPAIAKRAGELFSLFTGGKYKGLDLSSDFGLGIENGGIIRESGYLSTGTRDAAYLSLRIALCEVLFKEKPVLIFDEVFAYFDDERLSFAMKVLEALSAEYQIILFTCHERERTVLGNKTFVNFINL